MITFLVCYVKDFKIAWKYTHCSNYKYEFVYNLS